MLRNRDQQFRQEFPGDFARGFPTGHPPASVAPELQLDPKDERLMELSQEVGKLYGVNDLLQEDNVRLENEVSELKNDNRTLKKRNQHLEESEHKDTGARTLVQAIKSELENNKLKKGKK